MRPMVMSRVQPYAPGVGDHGDAVVLVEPNEGVVLPIFIGGSEALSIRLRLADKRCKRPLTHDLLDALSVRLGAKLVRVQVDAMRNHAFIGSVVFERGEGELITLDARPSDAIALAVGNGVPIYCAKEVLDSLGITADELRDVAAEPTDSSVKL